MKKIYSIWLLCAMVALGASAQEELKNYPLDTINGEEVYQYRVERSIGLYRIGVNFDVPQADIIRLNPQLRERGLHFDEVLLIPTKRKVEKMPQTVPDTAVPDTAIPDTVSTNTVIPDSVIPDSVVTDTVVTDSITDTRRVVELALMLPFESRQTKRSGNAERMMEFYQGALLALKDLQNDSTLYRLRVYDTERSERRVRELCDSTELDSVQGVLGLVYPIQIELMAKWCAEKKVPLLLPFSDDIPLGVRPCVLQFNSTDKQEADSLCRWIAARADSVHCVAVEVKEGDLSTSVRILRRSLRTNGIEYTGMGLRELMNDSAAYALDSTKENLIILHSDRFQHVRMLLPHLENMQDAGYRIRLVSQYSWQKEQIRLPQVYTSVFTTEKDHEAYDRLWEDFYVTGHVSDMPRYDLLGYDLMHALVGAMEGKNGIVGMQSDIRWEQVGEGGWQNGWLRVIEN